MEIKDLKQAWPSITDGIVAMAKALKGDTSPATLCWMAWNANHPNPIPCWKMASSCAAQPTEAEKVYYSGWVNVRNAIQWVMETGRLEFLPTQKECEDCCAGLYTLKV